jgi:radical SAM superfamily enzyme YgiQ (UPF0313 family)
MMTASQRVLLINPTITSHRHARFPLAVMSLSASLDGKYESTIIDGNVDRDFVSTALRAVGDPSVAAVGVTVMGGPQLQSAIAVSKAIREKVPALPIIWGGAFPTVCPDAALNSPYVDYAVRAQGEDTLIELLNLLAEGRTDLVGDVGRGGNLERIVAWYRKDVLPNYPVYTETCRAFADCAQTPH